MEKNLNVAPTEQELKNAGFCKAGASNHSNYGKLIKRINDNLFVMFGGKKCSLCFDYGHVDTTIKEIEPTKAAINAEFKHFNQPIPQWEKPKPKVGEVWQDENFIFWVNQSTDTFLSGGIIYGENRTGHSITFYELDHLTKLADTLEEYYKEKFLKEGVTAMQETKTQAVEIATEVIEEVTNTQPHQYSYKGLKAEGKIPHDITSEEDRDSIEAFSKLLSICEALNGKFGGSDYHFPYSSPHGLDCTGGDYQDESPIYFTSEEAFNAFKSAPENVELFKTFLKIK